MFRKGLALCALALFCLPTIARADDSGNLASDAGPFELTLGGTGTEDQSVKTGNAGGSISLGYFVLPWLEVGARDSASYTGIGGSAWENTIRGAVDINIPINRFEPFFGVNVGYDDGRYIRGTGTAAPEAGLKFFVTKSAFLYGTVEYDFRFNTNASSVATGIKNGEFNYSFGIGLRF